MKQIKISYEEALEQLQEIIDNLQNNTYTLEQINAAIDKAKYLLNFCEESLRNTQDKITEFKAEN